MKVLSAGIISKFSGSALATSLSNQLYNTLTPQDKTFPYAIFTEISDIYSWQFALNGQFENLIIQFSIFSNAQSPVQVEDLYNLLITLYDWCSLTVTGYTHLYMRREQSRLLRNETDKYWQKSVDYRVFLEKS